uniref:hypothetical protein n=1 Tax=Alloprevotella sp. TaxID=1872471 RepID=UPI003FF0B9E5
MGKKYFDNFLDYSLVSLNHNAKVPSSCAGYIHRKIFPYKMEKMRILDEKSQEAPDFLADAYL